MDQIDLMRTSASRPDFLIKSTESLQNMLKFSGTIRWIVHEDCIHKELSNKVMDYVKGSYNIYESHFPPLGQGDSLSWLMERVSSKYVLNFEDDFEPIKEIDVDKLVDLMEKHTDINQIAFHKRPIMSQRGDFKKVTIVRDGIDLTTNPHWAFTPSLFRLSFLKPKWRSFSVDVNWGMNSVIKGGKRLISAEWVMQNTGTYFLGRPKNKNMLIENGGTMDREEYDKVDNGFYAYHLGQSDGSVREGKYHKGR
jgi:hypothetical protein